MYKMSWVIDFLVKTYPLKITTIKQVNRMRKNSL